MVSLRIVRNVAGWDEYVVRYCENGVYSEEKSYFTIDKDDAERTRETMAEEIIAAGKTVLGFNDA